MKQKIAKGKCTVSELRVTRHSNPRHIVDWLNEALRCHSMHNLSNSCHPGLAGPVDRMIKGRRLINYIYLCLVCCGVERRKI